MQAMWDWLYDDQGTLSPNIPITQAMVNLGIKRTPIYMGSPPPESYSCFRRLIKFAVLHGSYTCLIIKDIGVINNNNKNGKGKAESKDSPQKVDRNVWMDGHYLLQIGKLKKKGKVYNEKDGISWGDVEAKRR